MSRELLISGFILGVALRSFFDPGISFSFLLIFISVALFLSEYFYNNFLFTEVKLKRVALLFLFASFGMGWYDFRVGSALSGSLETGMKGIEVFVGSEPEEKNGKLQAVVTYEEDGNKENILIKTAIFPGYNYGDTIKIFGEIKRPENFLEDFDYVSYLAKDDIYLIMDNARAVVLSGGGGSPLKRSLFAIRDTFTGSLSEILPEPHSSLAAGLIFGAKESLGREWLDKFLLVGLTHIIVLSGYNLSIIADYVIKIIAKFFSGALGSLLGAISIVLFTIMTGGGASTIRATIMALIILLARGTGRMYEASSALIVAGFVMVIHNPRVLVFDMSFQLSFLATLGILYLTPSIKKYFTFITDKMGLREAVSATVGAQIATAPLIAYKMGTFSLVALPVNMLVVLFIPITMFFGFAAASVNLISYFLAIPFSVGAYLLLSYELSVVDMFAALPFASVNVSFSGLLLGFFVIVLACAVYVYKKNNVNEADGWKIEDIS
jgi:competence protein ComEC